MPRWTPCLEFWTTSWLIHSRNLHLSSFISIFLLVWSLSLEQQVALHFTLVPWNILLSRRALWNILDWPNRPMSHLIVFLPKSYLQIALAHSTRGKSVKNQGHLPNTDLWLTEALWTQIHRHSNFTSYMKVQKDIYMITKGWIRMETTAWIEYWRNPLKTFCFWSSAYLQVIFGMEV